MRLMRWKTISRSGQNAKCPEQAHSVIQSSSHSLSQSVVQLVNQSHSCWLLPNGNTWPRELGAGSRPNWNANAMRFRHEAPFKIFLKLSWQLQLLRLFNQKRTKTKKMVRKRKKIGNKKKRNCYDFFSLFFSAFHSSHLYLAIWIKHSSQVNPFLHLSCTSVLSLTNFLFLALFPWKIFARVGRAINKYHTCRGKFFLCLST